MHLSRDDVERLVSDLHEFHGECGALGELLDERRERLLLDGFRDFLGRLLQGPEEALRAAQALAKVYFEADIPFALLMGSFNSLKERLIGFAIADAADPMAAYGEMDALFERAKRDTAREYLLLHVTRAEDRPVVGGAQKLLIRLLDEWMGRIRRAIREDLDLFPLEPADRTDFAHALRYPESMLICLDLKVCDQIESQHRLLVQQASILHALLCAGRHEHAYLAYQELAEQLAQLRNLLATLYFETETNHLRRFFAFVQAALYLPGRKFLAVVNLRQLNKINKLYGNEVGNRALARVERALEEEFAEHQSWMVYTRGIAGDFYVLALGVGPDMLEKLLMRLAARVGVGGGGEEALPVTPELGFHGIELTPLTELTAESMHLIVQYLTERGRREPGRVASGEAETETMMAWLREQHRRAVDLRAKLTEEGTDIFIQPLVTLDDRRDIHAFEVLGRFRNGEGYLTAGLFVDDIVSMGLTVEFDLLVLRAVVRHAETLRGLTGRLFINVFPASLEDERYLRAFSEAMAGPLAGFELILELTEQTLLERRALVQELHRSHGLSFAIDDFGTGYSNLQTVIELALEGGVRYLKIDGSLTRTLGERPASERVMNITRQMARELGLETVVELVETLAQAERVRALEIDFGQGYFLGVPDPVPVWRSKLAYLETRRAAAGPTDFTL